MCSLSHCVQLEPLPSDHGGRGWRTHVIAPCGSREAAAVTSQCSDPARKCRPGAGIVVFPRPLEDLIKICPITCGLSGRLPLTTVHLTGPRISRAGRLRRIVSALPRAAARAVPQRCLPSPHASCCTASMSMCHSAVVKRTRIRMIWFRSALALGFNSSCHASHVTKSRLDHMQLKSRMCPPSRAAAAPSRAAAAATSPCRVRL